MLDLEMDLRIARILDDAHNGVAKCVRSLGGGEFVSCGNDKMVQIWDERSDHQKPAVALYEHSLVLNHLDAREGGARLLCCDRNGVVTILDKRMPGKARLSQLDLELREQGMVKPVWRDRHSLVAGCGRDLVVGTDRGVEQRHDTGKKLLHACVPLEDASIVYGVTSQEVCCWTL